MSEVFEAGHTPAVEQSRPMGEPVAWRWRVPVQGLGEGLIRLGERLYAPAKEPAGSRASGTPSRARRGGRASPRGGGNEP